MVETVIGKKEKKWITEVLRQHTLEITFIKANGGERVMKCTLDPSLLPPAPIHETNTDNPVDFPKTKKERKSNDEVLAVYDIESDGWRSFRWDSLTQIKLVLQ